MTAAVVLAAGRGSRLAGVTEVPKWLLPVRDRRPTCPAEVQLDALITAGVDTVRVVVGDDPEPIRAALDRWAGRLAVDVVANDQSHARNNWYSLLLGLDRCLDRGDDVVVVVNSDLYAGTAWIREAVRRAMAHEALAALVIDPTRGRTDEAMKVSIGRDGTRVERIGKVGVDRPGGEYVGIARWRGAAIAGVLTHLRSFEPAPERADHWYEHAIDEHLLAGADYAVVTTPDPSWVEIDDAEDLAAARRLWVEAG